MSETDVVRIEEIGQVLSVRLNRPHVFNALNPPALEELSRAFEMAKSGDFRCLVISSEGENFCAGADLKAGAETPERMSLRGVFHPIMLALNSLEIPVIAAVQGAAAGGGLSLALAADVRIIASNARFVPAWVQIGFTPDFGASWFLSRLLNKAQVFDLLTTGRPILAEEAKSLGLASRVVDADRLYDTALSHATLLAEQPGLAVPLTKALIAEAGQRNLADQLEAELKTFEKAYMAPGREEAVSARWSKFSKDDG